MLKDCRDGYQEKFIIPAETLMSQCKLDYKDKEALTDFNFKIKHLSSLMFNETKKLLEELKKIKK